MTTAAAEAPRKAELYRMVMPGHICPFGLKARWLLKRKGYAVDDHWLTSRAETDAFKAAHNVATTPQIFIDGQRIGGHDDLRRFFGLKVADPQAKSYTPVLVVFAVAGLLALVTNWLTALPLLGIMTAERFIAIAMMLLAMLKLQDVDRFATMFLNYDLLARRLVPYGYVYPFLELGAGTLMLARALDWLSIPCGAVHRRDRRGFGVQGGLSRKARTQMRLRRRQQQCAAGLRVPDGKCHDGGHGAVDAGRALSKNEK